MYSRSMVAKRVAIVILAWNGLEYTERCLETLRRNTVYGDYRVIVVDNGSQDGSAEYLRGLSWITPIENPSNVGFVRGNNQAISMAERDSDIILLNNDTEIHQSDWIEQLQRTAYGAQDIGIVGCRLRRPNGMFQHAGTYMPPTYWGQQWGAGEKDINQFDGDREVQGVVFACVYIKREVIEAVGLLDEEYFSYFEDSDYCLKARAHGYKTVCCGSVTILHHENISTAVNHVEHEELFLRSQKVFRRKWEEQIESQRYNRKLNWHSLINFMSGYAISSKNLVLALDRLGVEIAYKYVYGPGTVFILPEPEATDSYMINVIKQRKMGREGVQVVFAQGDVLQSNFGSCKVGYTMLETDGIPAEWVRQANLMDEVWVPSTFNVGTFQRSGVTRPIHVIPLGIDPDYFNPKIVGYHPKGTFTFLSVFEWGERKAPEILLKAFNDEFRSNEEVILICRILNRDSRVSVSGQVRAMDLREDGGRIIFSLNEVIPNYQIGALYRSADCFVLSTRGEGWGMPILEAMACGLPVIATDWSAPRDFMNDTIAYPLRVEKLVPAVARCPYYEAFRWAEPSYEHLRVLMRYVYEHRDEAQAKGMKASQEVLEKWTWAKSAQKIAARIDGIRGVGSTTAGTKPSDGRLLGH